MGAAMANLAVGAAILLAGVSLALLVVGAISYQRTRHIRLLWVSLAFLILVIEGILLAMQAFNDRAAIAADGDLPTLTLLNLGIVLALYLAVLKR